MRSSLKISIIVVVLAVLLLPAVVYAAGPFYTSNTGKANGDGTAVNPRLAGNATELAAACTHFGTKVPSNETATLYWILVSGNTINYFQYSLNSAGTCTPVGALKAGAPPGFGVPLTPPIIIGGLIALGLVLMSAALLLRRQLRTGARLA